MNILHINFDCFYMQEVQLGHYIVRQRKALNQPISSNAIASSPNKNELIEGKEFVKTGLRIT